MITTNKMYAYENYEGGKGVIIATSMGQARKLFSERYPNRKIAENDEEYWNNGAFLYELGDVERNKIYNAFEH